MATKKPKAARQHNNKAHTREDIGIYVRSSWEANYVRLLNALGIPFKYEPKCYDYPFKKGNNHYTPDFQLWPESGAVGHCYHELKGYMDEDSKVKIKRFLKYYSQHFLSIISNKVYRELELNFSYLCPHWEYDTKKAQKKAEQMLNDFGTTVTKEMNTAFLKIIQKHQAEEVAKVYVRRNRNKGSGEGPENDGCEGRSNPKRNQRRCKAAAGKAE